MSLNKKLSIIAFMLIVSSYWACDICGNYMGLTPYQNRNSVSFSHRYRVFNGYRYYQSNSQLFPKNAYRTMHGAPPEDSLHPVVNTHSSYDFESFKVFELRFKYFVAKRVELNAFVPLLNNKSQINEVYQKQTGFGDISLNTGYHLVLPHEDSTVKQKLVIGAGIKLPTGYCGLLDASNHRMALEMQCGTGSVDGFVYFNYYLMFKKIGMNLNLSFKFNGENKYHEKMCNSATNFLSVFYKCRVKQLGIYPSLQANYEYTKGLKNNGVLEKGSGVDCLLLGPGLDFYFKSFSLTTGWQFTATEKIETNELRSAGRINVGLSYNFGGKESK